MIDIISPSGGDSLCSTAIMSPLLLGNSICWRQVLSYSLEVAGSRFFIAAGIHPGTGTGSSHLGRKSSHKEAAPTSQLGPSESRKGDQGWLTGVEGGS